MSTSITVQPSANNPFWQRREVLFIVRFLWITLALFTMLMLAVGLPRGYLSALETYADPAQWRGVAAIHYGLSAEFLGWYYLLIDLVMFIMAMAVSALLFFRGHKDGALILISLSILTGPVLLSDTYHNLLVFDKELVPALKIFGVIASAFTMMPYLYSPDGRAVPKWAGWVLIPWLAYNIARPFLFESVGTSEEPPIYLAFYVFGMWAQIYRYRHATPEVRQQYKWILYGIVIFIVGLMLNLVYVVVHEDSNQFIAELVTPFVNRLSFALLDVLMVLAILRYKLWDIDFVINRSIVYGTLTLVLGVIFVGGYMVMQTLIGAVFGQQQGMLAAALPGVVVAVLFNPTRTRVRQFVDTRIYGIELDYRKAARAGNTKPTLPIGIDTARTSFGGFSNLAAIGAGGMGEVYRAQHATLNRTVAIKILPSHLLSNDEARRRFLAEAQTIARLKHPNIVTMHDFGDQDGVPYMIMEFIDGQDMGAVIKDRGAIPLEEAAQLLGEVASALDYVHQNEVIHRDIKPSNVMIEPVTSINGRTHRAVLMDFGIAKLHAAGTQLTMGAIMGTLDYMAPEQIQGADKVTPQADIYSLGTMAYQMITGHLPFVYPNPGALVMAHLMHPAPDPRQRIPDLPEDSAYAIMQAMAKKPEQRFNTATEFVRALC